ncbi:TonB-dependent receptor [Mucilaginibacter sabulilitoris]|uniref:TonB-dependent receptor n=1 Tax=Mucilaginibacter sabulilitoris TaxID=1173583 RepID=A0ABZ0TNN0_9SPHI|nr:TonB-dependent receptor [Mucilaginibacter sabulilitoris]WPU92785.1 TonB-dependent receptor [Mucilaginibacter sabulilitoris]
MRITFLQLIILFSLIGSSLAKTAGAQAVLMKKISINKNGVTIGDLFKKLETDYEVNFVYSPQVIDPQQKVNVFSQLRPLSEVLDQFLAPLGLTYEASDDVIAIRRQNEQSTQENAANPVSITGKVVDEKDGQPLPGVTVKIKGSNTATTTNLNGIYTINVPSTEAVLVFSFVGYEAQEKPVGTEKIINITLKRTENSLNEVVVVGYGTQKRQYITGSVVRANLDAFRDAPNTNIAQNLQGTIPGLNVGPVTIAGSTPTISVRGTNTLSGNTNVLIILDGIQFNGSLNSINPDDIASIDVLKDASATAVYGAQAANGVLLIASRKGTNNQRPRINLSTSYTTQTPSGNLHPMERDEYLEHVRELYYNKAFLAPDYTTPDPSFNLALYVDHTQRDASNNLVPTDFNWWDAGTKQGFINDNQLSISGGGDKVNYLLSGNYANQAGFITGDLFKRKSLRANIEMQPTNWLKVGVQAFGSFVNNDGAEPSLTDLFQMAPLNSPYNPDGSLNPFPMGTNQNNPFEGSNVDDYERHNFLFANIYGQIDFPFLKGLSYRVNYGNNARTDDHYYASQYGAGLTGSAYKNNEQYYDYTIDNILTYNHNFKKHSVTATLLYGAVQRKDESTGASANGFTRLTLGYNRLDQGTNQFTTSNAWSEALNYQMARVNYAYDNRYLLTATVRRDGYSGFAANYKYAVFPSVSAGWNFSDEPFVHLSWLDNGKLRVGYGQSGNQTKRYYSLDQVSTQPAYVFGDGGTTQYGQYVSTLANPNLKWERTAELNFGLDFSLFKGRLSGSVDYYTRHTKNLLYDVPIPTITGFSIISSNIGEVANKGVELSLTSKNIAGKNFNWSTTFSFSRNVNKVLALLGTGDLPSVPAFVGQSINVIYGYRLNGIYQVGETPPAGYFTGNLKIADANGDGKISTDDRVILGKGDPAFRFSFLNSFNYKKLTLSFFVNSIQGGSNGYLGANTQTVLQDDNGVRWNHTSGIDFWSPTNPNGRYPMYIKGPAIAPTQYFSRSFVRLQDVSLSYKFENSFTKRLGVQSLSIFASGKNLYTWTKWQGWDPEIANGGLTINGRPLLKGYSIGLNMTL